MVLRLVPDLPSCLFMAVLGDLDRLKPELIPHWQTNPWQTITYGEKTILHIASMKGDAYTVERILANGANATLENGNDFGMTALHFAVHHKHTYIAKLLLDYGASVISLDNFGNNVIHKTVDEADVSMLKLLFQKLDTSTIADGGTPVLEVKDDIGRTALHSVTHRGNLRQQAVADRFSATSLLLDHKADVNARDRSGDTALHHVVKMACYHSSIRQEWDQTEILACIGKWKELLYLLMNSGADLDIKNNSGQTPLHNAARCKDPSITQILLDKRRRY
jgi:ankyrin repeat protein